MSLTGCALSVDIVELVTGLVAHWGDVRLVGDVIECNDGPVIKMYFIYTEFDGVG